MHPLRRAAATTWPLWGNPQRDAKDAWLLRKRGTRRMGRMTSHFTRARRAEALRSPSALALAAATALAALIAAPPADAASRASRHAERAGESMAPREEGPPIMAIVSLKSQRVTIYDADGWIMRAPVSSGQRGRETPAGVFSVIQKDADHHSNL